MPIPVACPSCASKLRAPDGTAGRKAKCPKCGMAITVPTDQEKPTRTDSLPQDVRLRVVSVEVDFVKGNKPGAFTSKEKLLKMLGSFASLMDR